MFSYKIDSWNTIFYQHMLLEIIEKHSLQAGRIQT